MYVLDQLCHRGKTCLDLHRWHYAHIADISRLNRARDPAVLNQEMEANLAELDLLFNNAQRRLQRHVADRRRQVNDQQFVHRMPNELLTRVLYLSLQKPELRDYYNQLQIRCLVCSRWAEAITSAPNLWGVAHSDIQYPIHQRVLCKSQEAPLDVVYDNWRYATLGSFHEIIHLTSHRWRSLQLHRVPADVVGSIMALQLPNLEDLKVSGLGHAAVVDVETLGSRLRHVTLEWAAIRWQAMTRWNLETLELRCIRPMGLSTVDLVNILRSSPGLLRLTLASINPNTEDSALPNNTAVIPLLRLCYMDIVSLPSAVIRDLWRISGSLAVSIYILQIARKQDWTTSSSLPSTITWHLLSAQSSKGASCCL